MPTHCAYQSAPPTEDDPFPLRAHCIWDEQPTVQEVAQGYSPPWKTCSHNSCNITFHGPCCATASVSHGLTDVTYDTDEMLCPEHNEKMKKAHEKEQIMLKHLTLQRIKHLERLATAAAESQGEDEDKH